jgi:hypothetical protein
MADLPANGYWNNQDPTNAEARQSLEDITDFIRQLPGGAPESELTISTGKVTPTGAHHTLDTEGDASSDDLTNLELANLPDGSMILLKAESAVRTVVLKHGAGGDGQVLLSDGADLALDSTAKQILLQRRGTDWVEVLRVPSKPLTYAGDPNGNLAAEYEGQVAYDTTTTPWTEYVATAADGTTSGTTWEAQTAKATFAATQYLTTDADGVLMLEDY